ncbi:MAG: hypothetical protein JNM89_06965 [Hyphomicrobiaceae bacterium]|nr:hypothetical protein [Hyphomicrobiaceae bacterium]
MAVEANGERGTSGGTSQGERAEADSNVIVRHFRHITLWPLQILPAGDGLGDKAETLLDSLSPETWQLVEDEFGAGDGSFQERHYREFVSFLPHVQRFLYGDAEGPTRSLTDAEAPLKVYRRTDISALRITLRPGAEPVTCRVAHVDLHFFHDVDAMILACEIEASNLPLATVKDIVYRFGRAYPPGWTAEGEPLHCAARVEWLGVDGRVLAVSDYDKRQDYLDFVGHHRAPRVAAHWSFALAPFRSYADPGTSPLLYRQIEYYRMPEMTYLVVDRLADLSRADYVRLTFASGPGKRDETPYSGRTLADFEGRYCYDRFYDERGRGAAQNTRFLSCGHAFTVIAEGRDTSLFDNERGLLGQFRHQYYLLFLISHFHKASILMLSDRLVATIKRLNPKNPRSVVTFRRAVYALQEAFMRFTQRYWFTEVSDQVQARDLFHMQLSHLGNEALYRDLRSELFDTVQYLDSDLLRRQSSSMHRLTTVTILGLIGTTATGYLGMNLIDETAAPLASKIAMFLVVLGAVAALTFLIITVSARITRLFDWMSGEKS